MWHAGGNDKNVSFGDAMRFATGDVRALPLSGRRHLTALHLAAEHECRLPVDDVEDIGLLVVHFDLAAGLAVTARHEQVGPGDEASPFCQLRCDFRWIDMDAYGAVAFAARQNTDREHQRRDQPDSHGSSYS